VGGDFERRLAPSRGTDFREGTPLYHNQEGVLAADRWTVIGEGETVGRLWSGIAFAAHPLVAFRDGGTFEAPDRRDALLETSDVRLHKGYVKLGLADTEIEVGRDSLWWGPAQRASLILSNEAAPLDLVKLSNPEPFLLPWILRYLGPIKGGVFGARLDLQRAISSVRDYDRLNPYLVGMRVQLKPLPWVELGLSRTIFFRTTRSDGSRLSARDFLKILAGINLEGPNDTSNQLAGYDVLVRLPFLRNTEVYVQSIGEDEAGAIPTKESYIGGVYIPRLLSDASVDFRVEGTITHEVYGLSTPFPEGYVYKRLSLGSPAGSDAMELWGRATWDATPEITFALEGQYWERAVPLSFEAPPVGASADETSYGGKAEVSWWAADWLQATFEIGAERIDNFNFREGRGRTNVLAAGGLRLDF
ncbi:MAG: capsule assembly Wzi family protein, partial [Candidatus Methylomirabilis sp.]|nr:capsule assembly Wzi family protein [Deltaproteobacteria bacterium]